MKKQILYIVLLIIYSCNFEDEKIPIPEPESQAVLKIDQINKIIDESMESTGDFLWSEQNINIIWSALKHSGNILTIGYGETKENYERSEKATNSKEELLNLIQKHEGNFSRSKILIDEEEEITAMDVYVKNKETLAILLYDHRVRYVEPSDYGFYEEPELVDDNYLARGGKGFGCSNDYVTIKDKDYRIVSPGSMVPWSFDAHNIPEAWNYSTGKGVTIAVVDTGLSSEQKWMNQYFNDGYSSGRTVQRYGTYRNDGVNDKCGHGTNMAAVATAPRNDDGLPVGVAYNANLITYRATKDVWLNRRREKKAVAKALIELGRRADVKIISMSLGKVFTNRKIKEAVKYAYKRGKMIFAAGGTSHFFIRWIGVIFPAKMKETVAVTGLFEGDSYKQCSACHRGKKIDFTIQMQRKRKTFVPTLGYYNKSTNYKGGSSIATAMTAGIAALIWEKHPNWTREQVLQKLKESSEFYPNRHKKYGYGNIDALKAVQ